MLFGVSECVGLQSCAKFDISFLDIVQPGLHLIWYQWHEFVRVEAKIDDKYCGYFC